MPLSRSQYWIFDLDGTLTMAVHDFDAMRDELGLPPGQPILEALSRLTGKHSRQKMQQLDAIEWKLAREALPQPGAHELLTHLASQGRQLGILTRNGHAIAKETLRVCGLAAFFSNDVIVGRESCTPKPDPAGINQLLDRWQAHRSRTVMVGDHQIDVQAGRAAGVKTVYFNASNDFTLAAVADVNVSRLTQLLPL